MGLVALIAPSQEGAPEGRRVKVGDGSPPWLEVRYSAWPKRDEHIGVTDPEPVTVDDGRIWYVAPYEPGSGFIALRFGPAELERIAGMRLRGINLHRCVNIKAPNLVEFLKVGGGLLRFVCVSCMGNSGPEVDNAVLAAIAASCPKVEVLSASGPGPLRLWRDGNRVAWDDDGVAALSALSDLRVLQLIYREELRGTGFAGGGFRRLESVVLSGSGVSVAGCEAIAALPRVAHVDIRETRVPGSGLRALAKAKGLKELRADGRQLDPADLEWIRAARLEYLEVDQFGGSVERLLEVVKRAATLREVRIVPPNGQQPSPAAQKAAAALRAERPKLVVDFTARSNWGG